MTAPINPLVAARVDSTQWFTGIGIAESIDQIIVGVESESWVDTTLGGVGTVIEGAVVVLDPVGSLITAGFGWAVEHVEPLSWMLDQLAGDPDQIVANAQTWRNVAKEQVDLVDFYRRSIEGEVADWSGVAAGAYRAQAVRSVELLGGLGRAAEAMAVIVEVSGALVGMVRALVRDLIGELVAILIARIPLWVVETVGTFGIAAPYVEAQVTALVARWAAKITRLVKALIASLRRVMPFISQLDEIIATITRLLGRHGTTPLTGADGATPQIRWGGAGYIETPTKYAKDIYQKVVALPDDRDVDKIAQLLGVPWDVVKQVKEHLFIREHDVPVNGQLVRGNFTPADNIAGWWDMAMKDGTDRTHFMEWTFNKKEIPDFKRLLLHEYVESRLMEAGMPYQDLDRPFDISPESYGAHYLTPSEDPKRPPFGLWPLMGKVPPLVEVADDFSNIDEIAELVLKEMPERFRRIPPIL